jgi:Alw26I/Eco31I/Esp3I family type II restriction m6 adenine DNA methyltransferase
MISKEKAYLKIQELVARFGEQIDSYKQADYNETLTRRDFIDPFFKALGWDVDNSQGYAEAYREVIHEDKVKVGKATKAPDYSFRLPGGKRLFFVEAKKPNIDIKNNISVAYQIRRYGWSAKLPVSIITDFEEFAVYDCTKKPKPTDKSGIARIKYIKFNDYLKEFDYLWDTFSKERVLKGSFDKYIKSDTVKKGTATVDKDFLASLDNWRTYLATSISLRNKELDEDEINYAVQLTIDRLIFLRIAEDRGVEQYGQLKTSVNQKGDAYQNLFSNFKKADDKYNSGLFDFKKDVISESLKIDNKVIKTIINEMYYPESPYEFSVISVEILGSAYEQFLGKVIRITPAHQAKIEEKPEVRKAGGVYYTPQYVVDYIVKNTVGKLIDGKTPKQIEKIKICDPACGSGSFLIGAYQYLLDHYKNYYYSFFEKYSKDAANNKLTQFDRNKAIRERNKLPLTPEGELDSHLRKEILLNHIFGVDIDTNAVEVTKLSLLLKCMEGITVASIQKLDFKERVLPTLENNIKSGNSLVDVDFYDSVIDFGEEKKVKPFSWQKAFPEVFEQSGFDAVIGNPPYDVLEKDRLGEAIPHLALQKYIQINYSYNYALGGKLNLYRFFVVKTVQLTKKKGKFGLIIPSSILGDKSCSKTRDFLLSNTRMLEFDCFPQKDNPTKRIFEDAKLSTTIFFGEKTDSGKGQKQKFVVRTYPANSFEDLYKQCWFNINDLKIIDPDNFPIPLIDNSNWEVLQKIHTNKKVKNIGVITDFVVRRGEINQTIFKEFIEDFADNNERLIKGVQIGQYRFNKKLSQGKVEWFNEKKFRKRNSEREISKLERIALQRITGVDEKLRIVATIIHPKAYFADSTNSVHIIENSKYNLKYILGLLNSRLFQWRFKLTSTNNNVGTNELNALPFREIDFNNIKEIEKHDKIAFIVDKLIQANLDKTEAKLSTTIQQLNTKIDYYENKINQLVYQLYELTEEEIKIVEGKK